MPIAAPLAAFPTFEVEIDKQGVLVRPDDEAGAVAFAREAGVTDLFVVSHGWNNDRAEARDLYTRFFAEVRRVHGGALPGRSFGVLALYWPSRKFAERDLTPGGAASVADRAGRVEDRLAALRGFFDAPGADRALELARAALPRLEDDPDARRGFVDQVRSALIPPAPGGDPDGARPSFQARDGDALLREFARSVRVRSVRTASPAAGLRDVLGSVGETLVDAGRTAADAAGRVLSLATYYQMKERAGTVGAGGASQVLRAVRAGAPAVRLHLIGHSFGARLVTTATLGRPDRPAIRPDSLTLLQAAFSHHGFSGRYDGDRVGYFRRVVAAPGLVGGPILVTHTDRDWAVGIAYALASRLAGQTGASVGDGDDRYGGLGRNGARDTAEAVAGTLGPVGTAYAFRPGRIHNLRADALIRGHGDISRPEVAAALLAAVRAT